MEITDCTCKGINPSCEKCFGRGYYDAEISNNSIKTLFVKDQEPIKKPPTFAEEVREFTKIEMEVLLEKLTKAIDFKSAEQFQFLHTLYIKNQKPMYSKIELNKRRNLFTTVYRLQREKFFLKDLIKTICEEGFLKSYRFKVNYSHPFSKKRLNLNSMVEIEILKNELRSKNP
jgi:hypothetical protein